MKFIALSLLSLVFVNYLVAQSVTDYEIKKCETLEDGVYPMRDLRRYMICNKSVEFFSQCNGKDVYDPYKRTCVPISSLSEENFCRDRPSGDWIHPWNCSKYIHCYYGWKEVNNCPDGMLYDSLENDCVNKAEVPYCMTAENARSISNTTTNSTNYGTDNQTSTDMITSSQLLHRLQNNTVILIDVRMPWELKDQGRIAQSINIPLPLIESAFQLDKDDFMLRYQIEKPSVDNCYIVFYCKAGPRSQKALDIVSRLGYKCAMFLEGGFDKWKTDYRR